MPKRIPMKKRAAPQPPEPPVAEPLRPYVPPVPIQSAPAWVDRGAAADAAWKQEQRRKLTRKVPRPEGVRGPEMQSQVELDGNVRRQAIFARRRGEGKESRQKLPGGGETSRRVEE